MATTPTPLSAKLFGGILLRLRKKAKLTHKTLAEKAGCSPSYISRLEQGQRNPSIDKVIKLSHALDRPAWKLLQETERKIK